MGNDKSERRPIKPTAAAGKGTAKKPVAPLVVPQKKAPVVKAQSFGPVKGLKGAGGFLSDSVSSIDIIPNEEKEKEATDRLRRFALIESYIIIGLSCLLVLGQPLFEPLYTYYSLSPQKKVVQLVALNVPNMTNGAVLAWSASGITELMTIGFGDFEGKMIAQKWRFTPDGGMLLCMPF